MKAKLTVILASLSAATFASVPCVQPQTDAIEIFKNGYAHVTKRIPATDAPRFAIASTAPVFGTFWTSDAADVSIRAVAPKGKNSANADRIADGTRVRIYFKCALPDFPQAYERDGALVVIQPTAAADTNIVSLSGTVLNSFASAAPVRVEEDPWSSRLRYSVPSATDGMATMRLKTDSGTVFVIPYSAICATVRDAAADDGDVAENSWIVENAAGRAFSLSYLAYGLIWAPTYRLQAVSGNELAVTFCADLRNEAETIENVSVKLSYGFPNFPFLRYKSLMNPETGILDFINSVTAANTPEASILSQSMALGAARQENQDPKVPDSATQSDYGIYHHEIGKLTLGRHESRRIQIASARTTCESLLEWKVSGRSVRDERSRYYWDDSRNKKIVEEVWQTIRFKNPFAFPLTTGVAVMEESCGFVAQNKISWCNPGEDCSFEVTKIPTIVVRKESCDKNPNARRPPNAWYSNSTTEIRTLENFGVSPVVVRVTEEVTGRVENCDVQPLVEVPGNSTGRDPVTRYEWRIELKPGETKAVRFDRTCWIHT